MFTTESQIEKIGEMTAPVFQERNRLIYYFLSISLFYHLIKKKKMEVLSGHLFWFSTVMSTRTSTQTELGRKTCAHCKSNNLQCLKQLNPRNLLLSLCAVATRKRVDGKWKMHHGVMCETNKSTIKKLNCRKYFSIIYSWFFNSIWWNDPDCDSVLIISLQFKMI